MGNTPAHHKRRLSGDGDYRFSGATPTYLTVTIPPSKRRNMHSLTDLSKSAPPDYPNDTCETDPAMVAELLAADRVALDEATSMLRAASLRDSINQTGRCAELSSSSPAPSLNMGPAVERNMASSLLESPEPFMQHRPASTGYQSPTEKRRALDFNTSSTTRSRVRTTPSTSGTLRSYHQQRNPPQQSTERQRAEADQEERKCPTVFRWNGGGRDIYISGTFNNWEKRVPMVKRNSGVYVIIDCTPGTHEYKYFIDGAWYHDPTKPTVDNSMGTKNNVVHVKPSDFDVIQALELDQANSKHRPNHLEMADPDSVGHSPPGEYGRYIPAHPSELQRRSGSTDYRVAGPVAPGIGTINQPPLLPPHLLQGIMNMDTGVHCDPNLLPQPNHVIVNHLYALSIKDGVIVLSVITRYRQKFVSTVFYRPIQD